MTAVVRRLSGDSLLLIAPNGSKILVNCQEGCQRSFLEYAQRLSTVSCICLASARVEHAGGLPGALLTILDSSSNSNNNSSLPSNAANATDKEDKKGEEKLVHVIGPSPSTKALLSSLRHFMNLRKRVVVVEPTTTTTTTTTPTRGEGEGEPPEEQEEIVFSTSFYSIRMLMPQQQRRRRQQQQSPQQQQQQQLQEHEPLPQRQQSEEDSSPLRKRPRTDHDDDAAAAKVTNDGGTTTTTTSNTSHNHNIKASFVFQTPRVPGKFQPERARALGVPKGPLFAQLCQGRSVTLDDGTVVASHQVMTADAPPLSILVLHYYDNDDHHDYDDDEDKHDINDELLRLARAAVADTTVELVVHMVPNRAIFERYRTKLMWPDNAAVRHQCHVCDAPHTFQTARRAAYARSLLCSAVYAKIDNKDDDNDTSEEDLDHQVRWEYTLLPRRSAGWKAIHDDDDDGDDDDRGPITAETLVESTGALALAHSIILQQQQAQQPLLRPTTTTTHTQLGTNEPVAVVDGAAPSSTMDHSDGDHHNNDNNKHNNDNEAITFLGTGCAIPCKYRNVSGIYVAPHGLALDTGEGTWAQMRAMSLKEPPRIVWISHPHADHHLGLLTLLRQQVRLVRRQDPNEAGRRRHPVLVIAPTQLKLFLQEYCALVDPSMAGAYEFIETSTNRPLVITDAQARRLAECGITAVHAVKVAHCNQAFAGVFDTTSRWRRLVYSGDCRPSQALQQDWPDCHVLIHEATFADDLVAEAVLKKHSTVSEAVAVGKAMKAQHVILTHFSQRYPKAPPPYHDDGNVIFAHDYMRLTANSLPLAKAITGALRKLYPEEALVVDKDATTDLGEKSPAEVLLATPGLFADPKMLLHS
jgi:ribonuclease Z